MNRTRCPWGEDRLYHDYHDKEWGTPLHDERMHFELLVLEGFQAGLSWRTILKKREAFRQAFDNFDVKKVARYGEAKIAELLQNKGIIRNRLKVNAAIKNARAFMAIQDEFGSFDQYIWSFVDHTPIQNNFSELNQIPAETGLSRHISQALKKRGMSFVGPTIIYAHMQSIGLVNDHLVSCFRHKELGGG